MKVYLTERQRGNLLKRMSFQQRDALFEAIKVTYKSYFGNLLAKSKGSEEWEFFGYVDHGKMTPIARCECGQQLRYQFILENRKSKKKRSLGIFHLQEELQMPESIAKDVYLGVQTINYDLDELLIKWKNRWNLC